MKSGWVNQNKRERCVRKWAVDVSSKNVPCLTLCVRGKCWQRWSWSPSLPPSCKPSPLHSQDKGNESPPRWQLWSPTLPLSPTWSQARTRGQLWRPPSSPNPVTDLGFPTVTICPPRGVNTTPNHLLEKRFARNQKEVLWTRSVKCVKVWLFVY